MHDNVDLHARKRPMDALEQPQTPRESTLDASLETTASNNSNTSHSSDNNDNDDPPGMESVPTRPPRPSAVLVNGSLISAQVIFGLGSVIAALGLPACNPFAFALYREVTAGILLLSAAAWSLQFRKPHSRSRSNQDNDENDNNDSDNKDVIVSTRRTSQEVMNDLLAPLRHHMARFLWLGLAIYGNQAGSITGIKLAGPVTAAIWQPSQPIMTAAICMALRWEPWNGWRITGVLVAFVGCVLMVVLDYEKSSREEKDNQDNDNNNSDEDTSTINPVTTFLVGNVLFFINCLGTSLYVILSKKVLQLYPPLVVTAWSYSLAALFMALTTLLASTSPSFMDFLCPECTSQWTIPRGALFALTYFILFNSCAAYAMITWANNYATGTLVMGYTVLQPVTAALLTILLLVLGAVSTCHDVTVEENAACLDPPGWGSLCGMLGVFAGLYLMISTEPKGNNNNSGPGYTPVVVQSVEASSSVEQVSEVLT